jgi:acetyl esterase/lipase
MRTLFGQVYASPAGIPLKFDLFQPEPSVLSPLVVCIHGGGWISGERSMMHEVALDLASQGFAAACPDYRLAPLHPYPAAVEDVFEFVRFIRKAAADLGIAADRIGVLGNSAGGHISAMLATASDDARVEAAVAICPLTDLTDPVQRHFAVSLGFIEQFLGGPYEGREDVYSRASPITHASKAAAPMLLIHGDADDIVPPSQSEQFADALARQGVKHELHLLPGESHSFSVEAWERIEGLYRGFFEQVLRQPAGARDR